MNEGRTSDHPQKDGSASVTVENLPRHFDAAEAEARWIRTWEEQGVYRYRPGQPRDKIFSIDTPPPTVSGSLHIGHVFSYTQTDVVARYQRMRGREVFYPMGWDDNGLPTERRVQNYYHVTCDPSLPYDPALADELGSAVADPKRRSQPPKPVPRRSFIELCARLTAADERAFMDLWKRAGLSVDWGLEYATIGDRARRIAQESFVDLHEKGHVYSSEAPTMWDVDFQTAVAQAELVDREEAGAFYRIEFGVADTNRTFTIATTRPELLAACVGVTAHPDDPRYRDLFGRTAETPLFGLRVPIFASMEADPEKGTGILMVCTFGDATDVEWWRREGLPLRQIVGSNGCLADVSFEGSSADPGAARAVYSRLVGLPLAEARRATEELLRRPELSARGDRPALLEEPEPIRHAVKFYEKGSSPIEFITTRQWFVRLLDKRGDLLAAGEQVGWHPPHMGLRYRNWTENLQFDWCVSRQRFFGVAIPVWYPLDQNCAPVYDQPILPPRETLPVDPMTDSPPGYTEKQRGHAGGFTGDPDVFDTWFTSSLTPQLTNGWPARAEPPLPYDVRPQAHDIIRTWAFYTIVKSLFHEGTLPWRNALISGWILDPDRRKMSKSVGNVVTPMEYLDRYTADGVRYWAASARLGADTAFDEQVLKVGRRLVTKLYNAGKFVLGIGDPAAAAGGTATGEKERSPRVDEELDRAFVAELRVLAVEAGNRFDVFDYAGALQAIETFFYARFTDSYIELVKTRARSVPEAGSTASSHAAASARAGLRIGLNWLLRLFAPFLPFVTEEIWSWAFAAAIGLPSIHRAPWPEAGELAGIRQPEYHASLGLAAAALRAIHKEKTLGGKSLGTPVRRVVLTCGTDAPALERVAGDVAAAGRAAELVVESWAGDRADATGAEPVVVKRIDFG